MSSELRFGMEARPTGRLALGAAILAIVAVPVLLLGAGAAPASSHGGLGLARAEAAARKLVLADSSYRELATTRDGLETRRCRHARARVVRCSLYVVVGSPCALDRDPGDVCAQALWERRWLVEVRRGRHGRAPARILKISSGPSAQPAG
jgi:hypothetical protein